MDDPPLPQTFCTKLFTPENSPNFFFAIPRQFQSASSHICQGKERKEKNVRGGALPPPKLLLRFSFFFSKTLLTASRSFTFLASSSSSTTSVASNVPWSTLSRTRLDLRRSPSIGSSDIGFAEILPALLDRPRSSIATALDLRLFPPCLRSAQACILSIPSTSF